MKVLVVLAAALLVVACADNRSGGLVSPFSRAEAPQPSADVREAQQQLRTLGLYGGPIDGLWGPETQSSVERFQRSRNLAITNRVDQPTLSALRGASAAVPVTVTERTDVRTLQNRLRQLNFYNGPADGVWGQKTQQGLEQFQRARGLAVGQVTTATISAMGLDPSSFPSKPATASAGGRSEQLDPGVVRGIQARLRQLGFYSAGVDGRWGPATQAGLARFQRSRGLEGTGQLNPTTASALGLDPNNLAASTMPAVR
jgi:peptidoglycan hydrolase-like protein with peptidoglycan-binding domain